MRERVTGLATVDDTNWHTQTTLLCAALTVFQHAESVAQNGGSVSVLPDLTHHSP